MNDQFGKNVSLLLLLAAATFGIYSLKSPDSPAGNASRPVEKTIPNEQDVIARLWEDPLQAVISDVASKKSADKDWQRPPDTLAKAVESTNLHILLVSIPETPFPEDVEVRLRMRYAVQLALTSQDYSPDNGNALGYFTWPLGANRIVPVPYERFSNRGTNGPIFLLWLPEVILSESTNSSLGVLADLRTLLPACETFHFVGPRASGTLKSIVNTNKPHGNLTPLQSGFKIFSSAATAPDYFIDPALELAEASREAVANRIKTIIGTNSSTYFIPIIATDDKLTDLIAQELSLRGVSLTGTKKKSADEILVLAEADTSYGHSLPIVLQQSIDRWVENTNNPHKSSASNASVVSTFRYLRGLDQQKGNSQPLKPDERSIAKSPEEAIALALKKTGAMALGESQLDYAERLAERARQRFGRKLNAIGILGSDVYDKMILLRTLRPKFPNAVFFTTDLDARMWHPDYVGFTRNLIVASSGNHYGSLTNIPPFRDNYQAAVFDATLAALDASRTNLFRNPGLFELGRSGPVDLVPTHMRGLPLALIALNVALLTVVVLVAGFLLSQIKWKRNIAKAFIAFEKWVFVRTATWRTASWIVLILTFALGVILLFLPNVNQSFGFLGVASAFFLAGAFGYTKATHGRVTDWARHNGLPVLKDLRFVAALFLAVILTLAFLQIAVISNLAGEENFSWSSGTSAWPTEVVRLFVLAIAIIAIVWAWTRHVNAREAIEEKFHLKNETPPTQISFWPELWRRLHTPKAQIVAHLLTHPIWSRWPFSEGEQPRPAAIYAAYLSKARFRCRVARALFATALYLSLCFAMVFAIDGGMPAQTHIRGPLSIRFDFFLMIVSATTFVFLIFYVMDAVCLTARMLTCITYSETAWDRRLKEKTASEHFVTSADVPGYLDVQFAATKSEEVRILIILPLLMQFLFILARNPYFDNWSWPATLIMIFTSNMALAVFTWIKLRRVARQIRNDALDELDETIKHTQHAVELDRNSPQRPRWRSLLRLRKKIEDEKKGAYSNFIQDPTVVAMLLPSSAVTILLVLIQTLFRR